ncbi:hypothetical protein SAMN05519103_01936 [Rhizobiales bacterium GAS113]|nr:hypothetical protein SAMN05519103_01936 [Rhizobiales bacterium GAS113]
MRRRALNIAARGSAQTRIGSAAAPLEFGREIARLDARRRALVELMDRLRASIAFDEAQLVCVRAKLEELRVAMGIQDEPGDAP